MNNFIHKLDIPQEIKFDSINEYRQIITKRKRSDKINKNIFSVSLFNAFVKNNDPKTFDEIAYILEMDEHKINKGLKYYRDNNIHICDINPIDIMKTFIKKIGIEKYDIDEIVNIYNHVKNSDGLNTAKIKTFAVVLFYLFLDKNKININKTEFCKCLNLSSNTLDRYYKCVITAIN